MREHVVELVAFGGSSGDFRNLNAPVCSSCHHAVLTLHACSVLPVEVKNRDVAVVKRSPIGSELRERIVAFATEFHVRISNSRFVVEQDAHISICLCWQSIP